MKSVEYVFPETIYDHVTKAAHGSIPRTINASPEREKAEKRVRKARATIDAIRIDAQVRQANALERIAISCERFITQK